MAPWALNLRTKLWLACMVAAFIVTHWPPPQRTDEPPLVNDKVLHFIGFTVLGFVTMWHQAGRRNRPLRLRVLWMWFTFLAAYAMIDEITQPLTGRSCELGDWLADLGGAALGMILSSIHSRATTRP